MRDFWNNPIYPQKAKLEPKTGEGGGHMPSPLGPPAPTALELRLLPKRGGAQNRVVGALISSYIQLLQPLY